MKTALIVATVALTLCVVAGSVSAIPAHCSSPRQWTGRVFRFDGNTQGRMNIAGEYFYDESGLRKARVEQVYINDDKPVNYQVIEDYKTSKYYEINLDTNTCQTGNLTIPFIPHAVPDNANFTGDFIIGSSAVPGGSVEIETWAAEFHPPSTSDTIYWAGSFTANGCIPIRVQVIDPNKNVFIEDFADVVVGIVDPNVFIVPPFCQ
jgi:hypothetical protein